MDVYVHVLVFICCCWFHCLKVRSRPIFLIIRYYIKQEVQKAEIDGQYGLQIYLPYHDLGRGQVGSRS